MRTRPEKVGFDPIEMAAGNGAAEHEPARVHAVAGHGAVRHHVEIGGGVTEFAAATAVTVNDDALHPVRPAERLLGRVHVSGIDAGPHQRGRHRQGVLGHQAEALGGEPELGSEGAEQLDVPGPAVSETEVLPHDDASNVQFLDQDVVHEGLRPRCWRNGRGEGQDQERVDTQLPPRARPCAAT